ncbi:MAG: DUF4179 domain-containing protein [Clostridium sp.]|uniref:DUF4179 domain-containing protein n=1 Tax=Clostridium sp. TaxID=1506 RepID=UPI003EE6A1B1
MDFKGLDKKVKKAISENINEVPQGVNERINKTLKDLDKKKKKNYVKIGVIAASAMLVLGTVGVTTTAVAKGIGVKDLVYEMFGYDEIYTKYAKEINEEVEYGGVKGTITSAIHDGYKIYISFKLESDTLSSSEIKERTCPSLKKIENIEFERYQAAYKMKEEGGNTVVGLFEIGLNSIKINEDSMLGYKEDIEIEVSLEQFIKEQLRDNLKFKIKASAKDVKDDIQKYKVNKETDQLNIREIIVTPFEIYVKGDSKVVYAEGKRREDTRKEIEKFYDYSLKDNSGTIIKPEMHDIALTDREEFTITYKNTLKDTSKLELLIKENGKEVKNKETKKIELVKE